LFDLAPPALIGLAVDVVVRGKQSLLAGYGIQTVSHQLWVLAFFYVSDLGCGVNL
jgi:ATP-binding cassette subfamily B protein